MKKVWSLLIVAACSRGTAKPQPEEPEPAPAAEAPPGALILEGEDAEQERARFAIGFVDAVADRDVAAIDRYTDPAGACAAAAEKAPPDCEKEMRAGQDEALTYYQQAVPENWQAGDTTAMALDEAQGIWMITVNRAGGDAEQAVAVILIEMKGRRYVVFPVKKEE